MIGTAKAPHAPGLFGSQQAGSKFFFYNEIFQVVGVDVFFGDGAVANSDTGGADRIRGAGDQGMPVGQWVAFGHAPVGAGFGKPA